MIQVSSQSVISAIYLSTLFGVVFLLTIVSHGVTAGEDQQDQAVSIVEVRTQQIHYRPDEPGRFSALIRNRGEAPYEGRLVWTVTWDVAKTADRGEQQVEIPPGDTVEVDWSCALDAMRYGGAVTAWLADRPRDRTDSYFGVSANVGTVGLKGESPYANYTDTFAWAPDDFGNMTPEADRWYPGQLNYFSRSKGSLREKIESGHKRGVRAITYGKGVSGGPDGIDLLLAHPEWAAFNRFGQLGGLDMAFDVWTLKNWQDRDPNWTFWNCWTPNFVPEEPVLYGAEEIAESAEMFGWDGVRFDAQFDVFGGYNISGQPLPRGEDRTKMNARNVRLMKERIREDHPNFTFGYNYGFPMPTPTALDKVVCEDGGLVMDEGIKSASDPQHPLQSWRRYSRHVLERSARVRRLGGVPLVFGSGLEGVAANYAIGYCLAGEGSPYQWDFKKMTRPYDAFATRYSEILWNPDYEFIHNPDDVLNVTADGRNVEWRDWVRWGETQDGTRRLIVHLFNPPPAATIRNTTDAPEPINEIAITLAGVENAENVTGWGLSCDEHVRRTRLASEQKDNELVFQVDELHHWTIVVLEGDGLAKLSGQVVADELPADRSSEERDEGLRPSESKLEIETADGAPDWSAQEGLVCKKVDDRIVLGNERMGFEIDPEHGGRVSSFVDRRDGWERVAEGRVPGLFFDHFYDQDNMLYLGQWGLDEAAPYDAEILESGPEMARVVVRREVIDEDAGVPNENYSGLVIEREFRLAAGASALTVVVRIRNESDEGRCPAYAMRNGYVDGRDRDSLRYYRPSRRGIHRAGPALSETDQMVWDPAGGWTATANTENGRGGAWLMDAGRVMMFYNSISAVTKRHVEEFPNKYGVDPLYIFDNASVTAVGADWYYRRAFIPAGATWQTKVQFVPLQNAEKTIVHADERVVVCINRIEGEDEVEVDILGSVKPFSPESVALHSGDDVIELTGEGDTTTFAGDMPADVPDVIEVRIDGRDSDGERRTVTFPYVPEPVAEEDDAPLPAPKMDLQVDSVEEDKDRENTDGKVLLLEGLGFDRWGIREMMEKKGFDGRSSEFMKKRIGTAVRYFPASVQEALEFDVIVMGAVDAFALSDRGVAILHDYVHSGGSVLVLGGLYSYGGGRFREFGLDKLLPVRVERTFDLIQPREKPQWEISAEKLGRKKLPELPEVAWIHELKPAPESTVWATVDDHPLITTHILGRGKVAAVAATPLGQDDAGDEPFWRSDAWQWSLEELIDWLSGNREF